MPFYVRFYHLPFYGAFYRLPVSCKRKLDRETGGSLTRLHLEVFEIVRGIVKRNLDCSWKV